jgi:aryl-alcohol dehydrogenase-like predicted oxidoreductase
MQYGSVPGLDKAVSRFVFGCDNQRRYSHGAAVWDDFFERGGTAFDTSWVYGGGLPERLLGAWIADRGVREELVVISKGAHTPRCYPDLLRIDFEESLDRMGLEYADIYLMHRDNPDVRVGEFVDALDELCSEGLIRGAVGGSNWSPERFEAARSYARENGKRVPGVLSNNLSLAEMVKPVWPGCVHMSDEQSRAWLRDSGISHFAWSSQARGYFLPPSERMKLGADNFACWDSVENRRRRERAETLARRYGCSPLNVAAAYVLSQPFNSFALIGPRQIHETADALNALRVHLSEEEVSRLWKGES